MNKTLGILLLVFISAALVISFAVPIDRYFAGPVMKKAAPSEYRFYGLYSDGHVYGYIYNGTDVRWRKYTTGGLLAIDVAPAFNQGIILDATHHVWLTNEDQVGGCTRVNTDTTGADFNDLAALYSYFGAFFAPSIDSTKLWAWGVKDSYKWLDGTGLRTYKPYVIWTAPAGKKIKKLATGRTVMILTTTGEVYERSTGASSFVQRTFTGTCVDIAASQNDFCLYVIHDYAGGDLTQGWPYWSKTESGWVGDVATRTEPFSLKSIWGLTQPIRAIATNPNAYIFLDSSWRLFAAGDGAIGECGDGHEIVNDYRYITPYSWSTVKLQRVIVPPVRIAAGHDWTNARLAHVGNVFNFYQGLFDANDSLWSWGRSKSFANWYQTANNENPYPNAFDILVPTIRSPMRDSIATYIDFKLPKVHAGGSAIGTTTTSVTVGGTDTAAFAGARNYTISSYLWLQKSGPNTANIVSSGSASTSITGLVNGSYVFIKQMTDNNTGVWADSVTVNVRLNGNPVNKIHFTKYRQIKKA